MTVRAFNLPKRCLTLTWWLSWANNRAWANLKQNVVILQQFYNKTKQFWNLNEKTICITVINLNTVLFIIIKPNELTISVKMCSSLLKGTKESVVEKLLLVVPETKLWGKQILLDYFDGRPCTSYYKKGCFHQILIKSVSNWVLWIVFEKPLKTFFWGPRSVLISWVVIMIFIQISQLFSYGN